MPVLRLQIFDDGNGMLHERLAVLSPALAGFGRRAFERGFVDRIVGLPSFQAGWEVGGEEIENLAFVHFQMCRRDEIVCDGVFRRWELGCL
jgi:hypothetical protein